MVSEVHCSISLLSIDKTKISISAYSITAIMMACQVIDGSSILPTRTTFVSSKGRTQGRSALQCWFESSCRFIFKWPVGITDRTSACEVEDPGSIPGRATIFQTRVSSLDERLTTKYGRSGTKKQRHTRVKVFCYDSVRCNSRTCDYSRFGV